VGGGQLPLSEFVGFIPQITWLKTREHLYVHGSQCNKSSCTSKRLSVTFQQTFRFQEADKAPRFLIDVFEDSLFTGGVSLVKLWHRIWRSNTNFRC